MEGFKIWKPQTQFTARQHRIFMRSEQRAADRGTCWDIHGAMRAGFHGIWIQRHESTYHPLMDNPTEQVNNLADAVDLVLPRLPGTHA